MDRRYCKPGMEVRVGFVLKKGRPGQVYLDAHEMTGLEAKVLLVKADLAIIEAGDGQRYEVEIEALHQRL